MRSVLSADETTVTRLGKVIPKVPAVSLKRASLSEEKTTRDFSVGVDYEQNNEGTILLLEHGPEERLR